MSERPVDYPDESDAGSSRMQQWHAEITDFYTRVVSELDRVAKSLDSLGVDTPTNQYRSPREVNPADVLTSLPATPERDVAQDRLANLKRELAAKLSNQGKTEFGLKSRGSHE